MPGRVGPIVERVDAGDGHHALAAHEIALESGRAEQGFLPLVAGEEHVALLEPVAHLPPIVDRVEFGDHVEIVAAHFLGELAALVRQERQVLLDAVALHFGEGVEQARRPRDAVSVFAFVI